MVFFVAPVDVTISVMSLLLLSILSEKNLPNIPTEWIVIANVPDKIPKPTDITIINPSIISGIDLKKLKKNLTNVYAKKLELIFLDAINAIGKAIIEDKIVAVILIDTESIDGLIQSEILLKSGGNISPVIVKKAGIPVNRTSILNIFER